MRKINEIILHCTDTPYNTTVDSIRNYHVNVKHWKDIGYHYLVDVHGNVIAGRPIEQVGAHCAGHNKNSVGIAYIGKYPRTLQITSMADICKSLIVDYPDITKISLHCNYNNYKTCPNFNKNAIVLFNSYFNNPNFKISK